MIKCQKWIKKKNQNQKSLFKAGSSFFEQDEEEFKRVFIYSKTNNPDRLILRDEDYVWINRNSITRLDIANEEEDEKGDLSAWGVIAIWFFIVFVLVSVILMICQQSWWRPFN